MIGNGVVNQDVYELAFQAVVAIDAQLMAQSGRAGGNYSRGVVPVVAYRDGKDRLLSELEEVIRAFNAGDLWVNGERVVTNAQA